MSDQLHHPYGAGVTKFDEDLAKLIGAYGWPDAMTVAVACRYACCTRWTLQRAVRTGALAVAGRRGRRLVFRKTDLTAWMCGPASNDQARPCKMQRSSAAIDTDSALALERIARVAKGG